MISAATVAVVGTAALATSFISGILGMAGGMILMGVLLAVLPLTAAMILHGVSQAAANGWRALLLRREVDLRVAGGFALGALLALAAFALLKIVASKPAAFFVMGLGTFAGMALPARARLNVERRGHPLACGLVSTAVALTAGVSGPILDLFFVHSKMSRHRVVATKAAAQSFSHVLKIVYFGGIALAADAYVPAWMAGLMVVLAFVGTWASRSVLDRMTDKSFRRWTTWTLAVLGGAYMVIGLAGLLRAA